MHATCVAVPLGVLVLTQAITACRHTHTKAKHLTEGHLSFYVCLTAGGQARRAADLLNKMLEAAESPQPAAETLLAVLQAW